eukprot:765852-Hanusia_phi.AAC.9
MAQGSQYQSLDSSSAALIKKTVRVRYGHLTPRDRRSDDKGKAAETRVPATVTVGPPGTPVPVANHVPRDSTSM